MMLPFAHSILPTFQKHFDRSKNPRKMANKKNKRVSKTQRLQDAKIQRVAWIE